MIYVGDSGRFLTHVLGTGRLFAFSGSGGIRLSSAFADFAFLRPVLKKKNMTEKTLYADSVMVRNLYSTTVARDGRVSSSVDSMTFSANPVTGVMVVTTLTVSGLDITVEPFPGIKPQLHEPVPGKRNDVQYLRLSRGKRAVYILPDMNAAVTGGGKRITLGGGTSRLFIIEPGSQGGAAKVKRVAANASVAEDPDSRDKHGDAASVFSARTSIYLRRADFGEDGLYSDLAKYCFRAARNLRAKTGGIRCNEQNWFCDAGSMSDYLHFASVFGLKPLADGIADTFYRMMRENGRFPQLFSQDGKRVGMPYNATSLSGLAAILSLFRYEEFYRLPHTRLCNLAGKVLGEQLPLIKTGMLPYSGAEPGFITGEFSGNERFHGSALNSLLFIRASSIYLSLPAGAKSDIAPELTAAVRHIKNSFTRNFCSGASVCANSPRRYMNMRLPHDVTGFCRTCSEYVMLSRDGNAYICPLCGSDCGGAEYSDVLRRLPSAPFFIGRYSPGLFDCRLPEHEDYASMSVRELAAGIGFYRCDRRRQSELIGEIASRYASDPDSFTPPAACRLVAEMRLYRSHTKEDYGEEENDEAEEIKPKHGRK